ncbi:hypothetical protein K8T06_03245 [bacterium]|nr:hypothetical protein [bacterium]
MRKIFSNNHWLVFVMFLSIGGVKTHAQQLEYPSAKDAVNSVLWEIAMDAAKIDPGTAMALSVMEILTIDSQAYADVGRGLYWADNANRQYEYNWGDRVVHGPRGAELRDTLVEFKKAGFLTEKEISEVRDVINSIPRNDLRINKFPRTVQDKINATLKVSISTNRSEIIKNVIAKAKKKAHAKKKKRSCDAFIGKWSWANGGVMTFNANGTFVWKRGAGKAPISEYNPGTWECIEEDKGIVFHKTKYGGYQGCFILQDDGKLYNYDCNNNSMGGYVGTKIR